MSKLNTKTVTAMIADAHAEGMTERDQLILAMVDKGASLNMATNAYSMFAKEAGLTSPMHSYKDEVLEGLAAEYDETNWTIDAVREETQRIVDGYQVAESTARDYCKAFSEVLGIEHPVLNPRDQIFAWFKAQGASANKDDFMEFAKGIGRSQSNANEYWKGYELHLYLIG